MASRGKGKVVARQAGLASSRTIQTDLSSNYGNAKLLDSSSGGSHAAVGAAATASATQAVTLKHAADQLTVNSCASDTAATVSSAVLSAPTTGTHQWRCASYLDGGVPVHLAAHHLGTHSSRALLRQHQPVLIRGQQLASCNLAKPVASDSQQQAADVSLAATASAQESAQTQCSRSHQQPQQQPQVPQQEQLTVLCSPATTNRFICADHSKNIPGSYYHIRKPETTHLQMTFTDWCESWGSWSTSRLLLQALVCSWELHSKSAGARVWPNPAVWPHLDQLLLMAPTAPPDQPSNASKANNNGVSPINWPQLRQLLSDGQYNLAGQLYLLAGGRDALLPAKYETSDRLICQVAGRQKLLLLPPGLAFEGLYPYPVAHPYDTYSCVDWEEPELQHWPAAAQVKGLVCELSPGDTLLIPAYWFVHSQLQQPACLALVLHLQPSPSKLLAPDGLMLQLSRMIECWVAADMGTTNVRHWLMAIAKGREWQQLAVKLASVQGYKQTKACHAILRHLQQLLTLKLMSPSKSISLSATFTKKFSEAGNEEESSCSPNVSHLVEAEARSFLASMCAERLMPTSWLNEGINDPLYLKYAPKHYVIREDAQAARYHSLFRHKLIEHRPDWLQHAEHIQLTSKQHPKRLTV